MLRATEVYRLQDCDGVVFMYEGSAYYTNSMNEIHFLSDPIFKALKSSRALVISGGIFEKTAEELLQMSVTDIKLTPLFQAVTRPDLDSQLLCIGDEIYYLKDNFLTDMPSGHYTFTDGKLGVSLDVRKQEIQSYSHCTVAATMQKDDICYLYRFTDNQYIKMEMV